VTAPNCPRCGSADTRQLANYGRPVPGRYQCFGCSRWFGPENPVDAGGTGEPVTATEAVELPDAIDAWQMCTSEQMGLVLTTIRERITSASMGPSILVPALKRAAVLLEAAATVDRSVEGADAVHEWAPIDSSSSPVFSQCVKCNTISVTLGAGHSTYFYKGVEEDTSGCCRDRVVAVRAALLGESTCDVCSGKTYECRCCRRFFHWCEGASDKHVDLCDSCANVARERRSTTKGEEPPARPPMSPAPLCFVCKTNRHDDNLDACRACMKRYFLNHNGKSFPEWVASEARAAWKLPDGAPARAAAVSLIERDGRLLCVWNKRYQGWSLPGGKREDDETIADAQERELREETGLETKTRELIFAAPHNIKVEGTRGSHVYIYRVEPDGEPRAAEEGCPITWLTRAEFLAQSPFAPFYRHVFALVFGDTT
jgi:ADP-ribose pyrophosphatase YjhB (NUDIX family)